MIINAKKFRNVLSNFGRKYILIKYIEPAKKILTRYRQITFFMVYIISLYLNATNDIIIENIIDIKNDYISDTSIKTIYMTNLGTDLSTIPNLKELESKQVPETLTRHLKRISN